MLDAFSILATATAFISTKAIAFGIAGLGHLDGDLPAILLTEEGFDCLADLLDS